MKKQLQLLLFLFITFVNNIYSYNIDHLQRVLNFVESDRTNRDLKNLDLSGAPLKGFDLSGGDFTGTNFEEALLIGTIWNNPEYSNEETNLTNLSFTNLNHARLDRAKINGLMLHTNAQTAIFNKAEINKAILAYSNFTGAQFKEAKIFQTNLEYSIIDNADMRNSIITNVKLEKIRSGKNVKFENAIWKIFFVFPDFQAAEITIVGSTDNNSLNNSIQSFYFYKRLFVSLLESGNIPNSTSSQLVEIRNFCDNTMPMPPKIYTTSRCPICQEDFTEFERIAVISCGHTFHENCINNALSYNQGVCPICNIHGITRFRSIAYMPTT